MHKSGTLGSYREYIEHIHNSKPQDDLIDSFADGYHDYLQAPLQPLMDNLQSSTYAVFESCPAKYDLYEKAIYQALVERYDSNSKDNWYLKLFILVL